MKILLVMTGGIACYKSLELIRLLKQRNIEVSVIMTQGAQQFITPLAVSALTGEPTYHQLFSLDEEIKMSHIRHTRDVDLVLVAPATANFIAKLAQGLADDLASTAILASEKPLYIAPAMNVNMWHNAAFQRNLKQLQKDGTQIIKPTSGALACGEKGQGRMEEPEYIAQYISGKNKRQKKSITQKIRNIFTKETKQTKPLTGKKALITLGATREPIDPVRYISNHSTGKQGLAIAQSLHEQGAEVTIIAANHTVEIPTDITCYNCETTEEMLQLCLQHSKVDIAIFTAAVADFRTETIADEKIKKGNKQTLTLNLVKNPEIVTTIAQQTPRPQLVIGFAAETDNIIENAKAKRERKGCDIMIANDVKGGKVFGEEENKVYWITQEDIEEWTKMTKKLVAKRVTKKIMELLSQYDTGKEAKVP